MSKECTLVIRDEVNVRWEGLDANTRRKLSDKVKFFLEYARHTPSYKLGRWDGMQRFCDIGGRTYLNLSDQLLPIVQDAGYTVEIEDHRTKHDLSFAEVTEDMFSDVLWPKGHACEGQPIKLREHQVSCANEYLNNPQCLQEVATGAGKTVITAILSKSTEHLGKSVIIVPSKDLVTQTERDYKLLGLDVGVYFGDRKEPGHQHTICTWQSIEALDKKSKYYDPEYSISDFTEGVITVIVDEAHGVKGDVLKKHLSNLFAHVPIRWGLTGTIPLEESEKTSLISVLGPIVNEITAAELQEKGILSNLDIKILQIQDYINKFDSYQSELKYLVSDKARIEFLAKQIKSQSEEGNTLVLVDRIASGELLLEYLPDAVFISGKVKSADRKEEYADVQEAKNKIIIATYGVASVGIDIPRIFNLFMLEPGKSFIRVVQSIGRGIRTAKDKDYVNVFDVCSSAKYSKRHLTARKKFYKQRQYPYKVIKVER